MYYRIIILTGILFITGCAQPAPHKELNQLTRAREQFQQKQYVQAIQILSEFLSQQPADSEKAYAYYLRGLCYQQSGHDQDPAAQKDFEQVTMLAQDRRLYSLAHVAMGHIYFESNPPAYESAILHYQKAMNYLPESPPLDAVLYRLAVSLQGIGQWTQADELLSRCFTGFKKSVYADHARRRFGARMFSLQVGAFENLDGAKQLVSKLGQQGWPANWSPQRRDGQLLYVVQTGQYNTFALAQKGLSDLTAVQPDAMIVTAKSPTH
ncbi:MAG: SPOR domain-containing protein [Sedimentisphaerales bacterium]|nr:SPOR domain-containing protein [Sedimentisphaerales bacterium]